MTGLLGYTDESLDRRSGTSVCAGWISLCRGKQLHIDPNESRRGKSYPGHRITAYELLRRDTEPADQRQHTVGFRVLRLTEPTYCRSCDPHFSRKGRPAQTPERPLCIYPLEELSKIEQRWCHRLRSYPAGLTARRAATIGESVRSLPSSS